MITGDGGRVVAGLRMPTPDSLRFFSVAKNSCGCGVLSLSPGADSTVKAGFSRMVAEASESACSMWITGDWTWDTWSDVEALTSSTMPSVRAITYEATSCAIKGGSN